MTGEESYHQDSSVRRIRTLGGITRWGTDNAEEYEHFRIQSKGIIDGGWIISSPYIFVRYKIIYYKYKK